MTRQQLIERLDRITADVRAVMAYDTIFWEVQRVVRRNPKFAEVESGRFNRTLSEWFTRAAALGIRRQLDADQKSMSLLRFLTVIRDHPGLVSRTHFVGLFAGSPDWLQATATPTFDRFAGDRGKLRGHIRHQIVSDDLRSLGRPSFARIQQWVDRYVAHSDRRGMELPVPRLRELSSCLRTLDRILCRYHLLLRGDSQTTVRATIIDDWAEVFSFAWKARAEDEGEP